jgi:hypothetical protein
VSWRSRIAIAVLSVLIGLPVTGTICAVDCDSSETAKTAGHHGSAACAQSSTSATTVDAASIHDCSSHEGLVQQLPATAAHRANLVLTLVVAAARSLQTTTAPSFVVHSMVDSNAPPDPIPPVATHLVLRV